MPATQENNQEIYLLQRDKVESARLNEQHKFLVKLCGGNAIHESIPKDQLFSIADVATGTGVWLADVKNQLEEKYPSDTPRYYHGFDISDAQFPAEGDRGSIKYSVHDCLQPFPAEHHGRYDLVHVRLLVAAIREKDYKVIVENLVPLLKPGGYIQWEDIDLVSFTDAVKNQHPDTPYLETLNLVFGAQISLGASPHVPETVYQAMKSAGLHDVVKHDYHTADYPAMASTTQTWVYKVLHSLTPTVLLRTKQVADEEAAKREAKRHIENVRKAFFDDGVVPNGALGLVVGRKLVDLN
ncbi:hypothetical protein VTN77DRAFT_3694 [Rasamsonia byssochlamydoides]|uniref:uncharacterized protein n=1 Tax=Rasamsonia byssochlamydoides TaxID=89139 RepID=UPI0037428E4C